MMGSISFEFYGQLQKLAGQSRLSLPVELPLSLTQALQQLAITLPELGTQLEYCACAIGDELVPRSTVLHGGLHEGRCIALLPPVAGG